MLLKMVVYLILIVLNSLSTSHSFNVNKETIVTRIGDEVQLICSAESEIHTCEFTSPLGVSYESTYYDKPNQRAMHHDINQKECSINITKVNEKDWGTWKCQGYLNENWFSLPSKLSLF